MENHAEKSPRTICGRVKSLKRLPERSDTYDIQTPNHNFFANGVLVHNSEILLRDSEFCNLSEVMIRSDDTVESLKRKVRLATILGTWQSSMTHFPYLSSAWKKNCEEERLLGVSLTGIYDNRMMRGEDEAHDLAQVLTALRQEAVETNRTIASAIGIDPSAAITCVKPSGTVSSLTDTASGIHPRHAEYYIRTVRADRKDPLCQLMIDKGFPCEPCVMKPDSTMVFSFPMKAVGSVVRDDIGAIDHLKLWLQYQRHWCEHKPSVTITVHEHEWLDVAAFVYENFDEISGISFLPADLGTYRQAPYQTITKEEYEELASKMPSIDWLELQGYEKTDNTVGTQTYACSAGSCEVVDLINN
jgi:ribonucleoside-triphosphate reductase